VILHGRKAAGALDVATDELAERRLIERALGAREHAPAAD
jgi:hypothetical protein